MKRIKKIEQQIINLQKKIAKNQNPNSNGAIGFKIKNLRFEKVTIQKKIKSNF